MTRFILSLLTCSALLGGSTFLLYRIGFLNDFPSYFWQTLIFLNFATILIYHYLTRRVSTAFVQHYLLTMVIKLFAYCLYNVVIILLDRENAGENVGLFLFTYLIFTVLELFFLYRKISG